VGEAVAQLNNVVLKDRYRILRELGRGGMATVYLAHDNRDDRDVAIKVLLPEIGVAVGAERFRREINVAARFSHPRILPLYDSGEWQGQLYYVMPYVAGHSLRARLDQSGPLGIDQAVQIGAEVADALDYAHEQGVVHRDIKPENILLEDGHALVVDFGIARAAVAAGEQKLTQTGLALGTPQYMSPEQGAAERNIDGRTDIYSLGCVIYEMLAGQAPFSGTTSQALIARHALDQVPPLSIVRPTVSPELEAVVLKSLEKVPADRFQTAREFSDALRHPDQVQISRYTATARARAGATAAVPTAPSPAWRRPGVVALAAVPLIAAASLAGWRYMHNRSAASSTGTDARKIAVTYFDDQSPQHNLGYIATGLTEGLIDQLSEVRNLSVISRGGVAQFKGKTVRPDSIGRALQVGTLVRGDVEQDGGQLHVNVRLVDAGSGADFDRASFDQPANKVLVLKDTLVAQVARMVRRRLGEEVQLRSEREATQNADAWALVQRAEQRREDGEQRIAANDTAGMLAAFKGADSLLIQAHSADGQWAEPLIKRALIDHRASRFFGRDPLRAAPWIDSGVVRANEALTLSPKNADALEQRGELRYWRYLLSIEADPKKAEDSLKVVQQDLEQATTLNPSQAGAWAALSHLYAVEANMTDSKLAARRAYEEDAYLSNADLVLWRLWSTSYDLEQFSEAKHWCEVGAHRFPTEPRFDECALRDLGAPAESADVRRAWHLADSLAAKVPENERVYRRGMGQALAAAVVARAGLADSARHVLARVDVPPGSDPTRDVNWDKAFAWLVVGDKDSALRELKIYATANPANGLADDKDWQFRPLRNDPRFEALVKKGTSAQ
jgi:serine/threonine-protein kinase